jgi:hypothetical protein
MAAAPAGTTPGSGLKGTLGGAAKVERRSERNDEIKI